MSEVPHEVLEALGLPENSTTRLYKLKIIQLELEIRRRKACENQQLYLEKHVAGEAEKLFLLKQLIENAERGKLEREKTILKWTRNAEFLSNKMSQTDTNRLDSLSTEVTSLAQSVVMKRKELEKLRESLKDFRNMELTNEVLKQKIEELKKSRLSLEVTFADEANETVIRHQL